MNTWSTKTGSIRSIDSLIEDIEANRDSIEGITLLGGEPLQQPEGTLSLIKRAKSMNLTVMLYTGYDEEEYTPLMQECHNLSDLVIGGRYIESLRDPGLRWRGSTNQKIISPTGKYNLMNLKNEIEVIIDHETGQVSWLDADFESLIE